MALFFAQLMLITYITLNALQNLSTVGNYALYFFCLLLPINTLFFWWHCNSTYYVNSLRLSRIAAVRMDRDIKAVTEVKKGEISVFQEGEISRSTNNKNISFPIVDQHANLPDSDEDSSDSDDTENLTETQIESRRRERRATKKKAEENLDLITKGFEKSAYAQKCLSEKPKKPEPFEYDSRVTTVGVLTVGSFLNRSGGEATIRKSPSKIYDSSGSDLSTSLIDQNSDPEKGDGYTSPISNSISSDKE